MGRRADGPAFRSRRAAADRAAPQGAARLLRRGHLLGLSFRDRRADADPGAHRADRQTVRWPVQVGRFRRREGAYGVVHGGGIPRHLQTKIAHWRLIHYIRYLVSEYRLLYPAAAETEGR